jgi:transposase
LAGWALFTFPQQPPRRDLARLDIGVGGITVIHAGTAARIYLVCGPTDMRKGYNGLSACVEHHVQADPLSGHLFVFCNRIKNRIKILGWDGSGLWVCAKRLEKGRFSWPDNVSESQQIDRAELAMLLGGLEWHRTRPKDWFRK